MYGPVTGSTAIKEPVKIVESCARAAISGNENSLKMEAAMKAGNAYRAGTFR